MSEEINPGMQAPETVQPDVAEVKEEKTFVNYAEKTLAELTGLFQELLQDIDRLKKSKEAEAIKSAFYKKLSKEKAEAGVEGAVEEPSADEEAVEEAAAEAPEAAEPVTDPEKVNPFVAIEEGFKSLYLTYKKERAEYNREQEKEREENLAAKQQVIEDLKALVDTQEDVSSSFPAFREIQNRWREIGPVPAQNFRNLNDTYQFLVEKFYDMVKINRDLRDLDFKKNLEAKEAFCQEAERLAENENVVDAFRELQKLHEQWKEFGPVAKEFREAIWDRFKAATAVINKKYQAYFEGQKEKFAENLQAKTALCEKVEAFAAQEIASSNEWNAISKKIEDIQKEWRSIGFASKKDNQKIYDRFRAACDAFYGRKREFYSQYKDSMNENLDKKLAIIEKAEALKESKEWKKTTDLFIELQKEWKEIGAVPRKKSEQLWKRFRAACDAFFDAKAKEGKADNEFYANLKAKRALIEEIQAFEGSDEAAMQDFAARWQAIGFVPFKEKENVAKAYAEAMKAKFPSFGARPQRGGRAGAPKAPKSEKDLLVDQYKALQQDIVTYENNIGFFAQSKNAEPLIKQMQERIDAAKQQLKELEGKIRQAEQKEEEEQ
ncbi:MAG: DUF349 domain-containing protein [Bacteroidales bacterium]|nr:DUF349 domain-containing protein [Bacteroidales bacterium]